MAKPVVLQIVAKGKYKTRQATVTIPAEHLDLLGWERGDTLQVTSDRSADAVTFKRVRKE